MSLTDDVVARLRAAGCVWAEAEAGLLLEAAASPAVLESLVSRRVAGEPLELVLGWVAFMGRRLRVATKYHHLVREFFRRHGVADYQLVDSQGATEGTVKNLTAEAVADITTTGSTLRDNHLRVLDDGLILRSEATLFLARGAAWTAVAEAALAGLRAWLGLERAGAVAGQ